MSFHKQNKTESQEGWMMNFKETYQKEMDAIRCPHAIQATTVQKITLEQMKESCRSTRQQKPYQKRFLQTAAVMAVVLCMTVGIANRNQIIGFAESIFQSFTLSDENQTIKLDPVEPVTIDAEAFCANPNTEYLESKDENAKTYKHYYCSFNSYEEMRDLIGFTLPNDDLIHYGKDFFIDIDFEHGYGHLCMTMEYQGMQFGANGMFVTEAFQQEPWGYGEHYKISEIYEYANGRYAYFFEKTDPDGVDTVYFVEDKIMFQLFVPNIEDGIEQAKTLLEAMGR